MKSLSLIVTALMAVFLLRQSQGQLQQDNYLEYSKHIVEGAHLAHEDWRLFPGLPLLISTVFKITGSWVLSSWLVSAMCLGFLAAGLVKIGKQPGVFLSLLWLPVLVKALTILSTESLFVAILVWWIWAVSNKKFRLARILGLVSVWVRLIGVVLLVADGVWHLWHRQRQKAGDALISLICSVVILIGFNVAFFGETHPWVQFEVYPNVGRANLALVQLIADVTRAIDWQWWHILVSGLIYVAISLVSLKWWWKQKSEMLMEGVGMVWLAGILLWGFVFSVGPEPFLEEFPRFLVPFFLMVAWRMSRFEKYSKLLMLASVVSIFGTII